MSKIIVGCPDCGDQCAPCDSTLIASVGGREVDLASALERARVVGVLDAWAATEWSRCVVVTQPTNEEWQCRLILERGDRGRFFPGDTPDAARATAARAIESGEAGLMGTE